MGAVYSSTDHHNVERDRGMGNAKKERNCALLTQNVNWLTAVTDMSWKIRLRSHVKMTVSRAMLAGAAFVAFIAL